MKTCTHTSIVCWYYIAPESWCYWAAVLYWSSLNSEQWTPKWKGIRHARRALSQDSWQINKFDNKITSTNTLTLMSEQTNRERKRKGFILRSVSILHSAYTLITYQYSNQINSSQMNLMEMFMLNIFNSHHKNVFLAMREIFNFRITLLFLFLFLTVDIAEVSHNLQYCRCTVFATVAPKKRTDKYVRMH